MSKKHNTKIKLGITLVSTLLLSAVMPATVSAAGYDPTKGYEELDLRFWENQQPPLEFYINATNKYLLETVPTPKVGSTNGEWAVMDLLRGMYTGADYINDIPENYFENYLSEVNRYITEKNGVLDRNKSTEWSRVTLPQTLLGQDITKVAGQYDFIDKFSSSHKFSYKQGTNGPIWELIALDSGAYDMYPAPNGKEADWNSRGKLIDYIIKKEIKASNTSLGGAWTLSGSTPSPDITGMVLQALAPYYLSETKYKDSGATTPYNSFKRSVERSIVVMSELQATNGGFEADNSVNSESIAQMIVGLTALEIDPLSTAIKLPTINQTVSFITEGGNNGGVRTTNMIDALLTFWSPRDEGKHDVAGFKHLTSGKTNDMATEQAGYALIAYDRYLKSLPSLYNMTDQKNIDYQTFKPKTYRLTYDYQGVTKNHSIDVSFLEAVEIKASEELPGRTFSSWNSQVNGTGTSYQTGERLSVPSQDLTLYAQYKLIDYPINFNLNGGLYNGETALPVSYTVATTFSLPTAESITREGYLFDGWYPTSDFQGEAVTQLTKETGEKQYYAKWLEIKDEDSAEKVKALIAEIGEVTVAKEPIILKAREAYNALTSSQKDLVDNYQVLQEAELELTTKQQEAVDKAAAQIVIEKIESIGEVTIESESEIRNARQAYANLTDAQKAMVGHSLERLEAAEARLSELKDPNIAAEELDKKIADIGVVTLANKVMIETLRAEYDSLSDSQKGLVTQLDKLVEAETTLAELITSETAAAKTVVELINSLPKVTLESQTIIADARNYYTNLSDFGKSLVPLATLQKLKAAEESLAELIANLIESINEATITTDSSADLNAIKKQFDQLSAEAKELISVELQNKLNNALSKLESCRIEQKEKAETVNYLIEKLVLGNKKSAVKQRVTASHVTAVEMARASFEDLENYGKGFVLASNLKKLEQAELEVTEIKEVEKAIANLPNLEAITLADEAKVKAVRRQVDGLSKAQQAEVTNLPELVEIELKIKSLKGDKPGTGDEKQDVTEAVAAVIALIDKLPEVEAIKLSDEKMIIAARGAYNALSKDEQATVTNYQKLIEAEQALAKLQPVGKNVNGSSSSNGNSRSDASHKRLPQAGENTTRTFNLIGLSLLMLSVLGFKLKPRVINKK